jgi:hypothetical protein
MLLVMSPTLSRPKGATVGLDLTAFNIQRGRDHGLPTYAKMLAFLGQPVPSTFDQLLSYIPNEVRFEYYPFKYFRCSCQNNELRHLVV